MYLRAVIVPDVTAGVTMLVGGLLSSSLPVDDVGAAVADELEDVADELDEALEDPEVGAGPAAVELEAGAVTVDADEAVDAVTGALFPAFVVDVGGQRHLRRPPAPCSGESHCAVTNEREAASKKTAERNSLLHFMTMTFLNGLFRCMSVCLY